MNDRTKLLMGLSLSVFSLFCFFSCSDDSDSDLVGNWVRRSDFGDRSGEMLPVLL